MASEAVRHAVGGGCQSGWGRLLSVTNGTELALAVRETVAGRWLGTLEGVGGLPCPPSNASRGGGGGFCRWAGGVERETPNKGNEHDIDSGNCVGVSPVSVKVECAEIGAATGNFFLGVDTLRCGLGMASSVGRGPEVLNGDGESRSIPDRRNYGQTKWEEVAKAVRGGYYRLQMPLSLALGVSERVAGDRLGALEWGGGGAFQCIPGGEWRYDGMFLRKREGGAGTSTTLSGPSGITRCSPG